MRVVGMAEIVVHSDGLDNAFDGFLVERRDGWCDDCEPAEDMLAELVVERTNLLGLAGHDGTVGAVVRGRPGDPVRLAGVYVTSLRPTIPERIRPIHISRNAVAGSANR